MHDLLKQLSSRYTTDDNWILEMCRDLCKYEDEYNESTYNERMGKLNGQPSGS